MTEEQEIATESCDGTSHSFASVWVKVEMNNDHEVEGEKLDVKPDVQALQKLLKSKKKARCKPTVHKCDQCSYTSIYKNCLKLHIMGHDNNKPFSCDACSYTTKYRASLQRHMFIKHQVIGEDNKTLLHCDSCDYNTYFKWNLNSHRRRHATNKQFQCEHCSYCTAYRHNFVKHSRVHNKTSSEFKCDKCPFVTKFTGHIQRHMSQIHNEVSEKASACDYCDFTTMVRWRLNIHKQRSRQENPIKCGRCGFQTLYMCESKKHKKSHFNELPQGKGQNDDRDSGNVAEELKPDVKNSNVYGVNENTQNHDTNRNTSDRIQSSDTIINGVCESGQNVPPNDIPKDFPKDITDTYGVNNFGQINEYNRMTKFLKGESDNLYDLVNEVDIGQIDANSYNSGVRMEEGFLKSDTVHLYDIVNNSGQLTNVQKENEIITFENTTNRNVKLTKAKNYVVDPKLETRKTIQVLESEDSERPFQCVKCAYTSKFKAAVIRHYQRLHTSESKPFKCCNCDFSTKTKDQISLHNKRSQSEGTLICNICNFTTNFKCTYVMHQKVHYEHKCNLCEYSCRNKYDIQKHFTTVHLGEGMKCRFCDYRSGRTESLLRHEAIHTGNKPFKCELCDYQSVRRSLLDIHFRRCHGHVKAVNKLQLQVKDIRSVQ